MAKVAKLASKQKRISDIASMLEQGLERKEICEKLLKTAKVSKGTIDREIKEAKTILSERNKQKEVIRQEQVSTTLKESINEALLSDLELEAILCKIATGNLEIQEWIKGKPIIRGVTPTEITNAIDKIYKKRGSNAPTKQQTELTVSKPIIIDWIGEYNNTDTEAKGGL
jgi:hypothetical protein